MRSVRKGPDLRERASASAGSWRLLNTRISSFPRDFLVPSVLQSSVGSSWSWSSKTKTKGARGAWPGAPPSSEYFWFLRMTFSPTFLQSRSPNLQLSPDQTGAGGSADARLKSAVDKIFFRLSMLQLLPSKHCVNTVRDNILITITDTEHWLIIRARLIMVTHMRRRVVVVVRGTWWLNILTDKKRVKTTAYYTLCWHMNIKKVRKNLINSKIQNKTFFV